MRLLEKTLRATNTLSIFSFLLGCFALLTVAVLGYAHANDDGVTGWLTSHIGEIINLLPQNESGEKGYRTIAAFAIYEDNLRKLLIAGSVVLATVSLFCACISAKREQFSLWYSAGVLLAGTALSLLHFASGLVVTLIVAAVILSVRNGMTRE